MHIYYVHPLRHVEGMLMAYLPTEKIVIEADLLDTHLPLPAAPTGSHMRLYNQVQTLELDVATIVPIHGQPVLWTDFLTLVSRAAGAN